MARVSNVIVLASVVLFGASSGHSQTELLNLERGSQPVRWTSESPDCDHERPFLVHDYNATFTIVRQSGCTNFEKPFLYLLFGTKHALLIDTGAKGAQPVDVIEQQLRRHALQSQQPMLPLVVVHSHGHGDHTAGDAAFKERPGTTVIDAKPQALQEFFGLRNWPREIASYDLGGRTLDIIPIPGHEVASIAIYDRRTGVLMTGDTLYPGRLYVRDIPAFVASVNRLVEFTATQPLVHVLGAHIENTRTPYLDYPEGTTFQPEEHVLELGRAHLLELQDALHRMGDRVERLPLRDFTVWPIH